MEYKRINFNSSCVVKGRSIYISGFGSVYDIVDKQGDIVSVNAFMEDEKNWKKGLKMPLMCLEHKLLQPTGKWFECTSQSKGLHMIGKLLETLPAGRQAIADLLSGKKYGLSIGYEVKDAFKRKDGVRVITKAKLYEVSIVTNPANEKALIDDVYIKMEK